MFKWLKKFFKKEEEVVKEDANITDAPKFETLEDYQEEYNRLQEVYNQLVDDSLKNGMAWEAMVARTKPIREEQVKIKRHIRQLQAPEMTFDKKWRGKLLTLEEFVKGAKNGVYTDFNGYGYYATAIGKSDIMIFPSDILENIYRDDFTHVIWFKKANRKELF